MNFGIIFIVFILQIVVALIVIFVLKKLLDRELVEAALEQFEALRLKEDELVALKGIDIISHGALKDEVQTRFKGIAARRFKAIPSHFSTDRTLKGGVKVVAGRAVIDCTLADRLQKMFGPQ